MQTIVLNNEVLSVPAANANFLELSVAPTKAAPRPGPRLRLSRSDNWHLAGVLSLLGSSGAYAVYVLLHMGAM